TIIEFSQLSLRDSGTKVSVVHLQEGSTYVNFTGAKESELRLNFGHEKLVLTRSAHLRVQMGDTNATLAVFKGDIQVEGPSGMVRVEKNQQADFDLANQDQFTIADNLERDPYDSWDKEQNKYHERYTSSSSYSSYSPYAYGVSDLNYYGSFFSVPG